MSRMMTAKKTKHQMDCVRTVTATIIVLAMYISNAQSRPHYFTQRCWVKDGESAMYQSATTGLWNIGLSFSPSVDDGYIPGTTYQVTLKGDTGYGLMLGSTEGTWSDPQQDASSCNQGGTVGFTRDITGVIEWTLQWTAPIGKGDVVIGGTRGGTQGGGASGGVTVIEQTISKVQQSTSSPIQSMTARPTTSPSPAPVNNPTMSPTSWTDATWAREFEPHKQQGRTVSVPSGFEYKLRWNVTTDHFIVEISAPTSGWVGLGIGEVGGGSMPGGDFVQCNSAGWVRDGYAVDYAKPIADSQQDWTLTAAMYNGTHTICRLSRKLHTNDPQDRSLDTPAYRMDVVNFLFAYGEFIANEPVQHSQNHRTTAQIKLWGNEVPSQAVDMVDYDKTLDFLNDDYDIPSATTTYYDKCHNVPTNLGVRSLIGVSPKLHPDTIALIHHYTVTSYSTSNCDGSAGDLIYIWAPGARELVLPEFAGITLGPNSGQVKSFKVETHFNNPDNLQGFKDNSGVSVFLALENQVRPVEMGIIATGDPNVQLNGYPLPNQAGYSSVDITCPSSFTQNWPHSVKVMFLIHHMHVAGQKMTTEIFRNGDNIRNFTTEYYDFNYQSATYTNFVLEPGDSIVTKCIFNSNTTTRSKPTGKFGLGSEDEMCIDYFWYYPKVTSNSYCQIQDLNNVAYESLPNDSALDRWFGDSKAAAPEFVPYNTRSFKVEVHPPNDECTNPVQAVEYSFKKGDTCIRNPHSLSLTTVIQNKWFGDMFTKIQQDELTGNVSIKNQCFDSECTNCVAWPHQGANEWAPMNIEDGCVSTPTFNYKVTSKTFSVSPPIQSTQSLTSSSTVQGTNSQTQSTTIDSSQSSFSMSSTGTFGSSSLVSSVSSSALATESSVTTDSMPQSPINMVTQSPTIAPSVRTSGGGSSSGSLSESETVTVAVTVTVTIILIVIIIAAAVIFKPARNRTKLDALDGRDSAPPDAEASTNTTINNAVTVF